VQRIKKALEDTKRNRKRVLVNHKAIACKSGNSKSISAYPDIALSSFSPKESIPIPYPNFAKADDAAREQKK